MKFAVLGSGSAGNAVVIETAGQRLLIDIGLSAKQITLRLNALGIDPASLTAVLLTHEHGDHIRGLDVFLRQYNLPVYASTQTAHVVQEKLKIKARWQVFESGQNFTLADIQIQTFRLPHDAVEPVGYVFRCGKRSFAVATDLGHADLQVKAALKGIEGLVLEANYECRLLDNDQRRPFSLKQRISSQHGHLSNDQAAELIAELLPTGLRRVVLGHLSSDCNTPEHAIRVVRAKNPCQKTLALTCAAQHEPTPWQILTPPKKIPDGFLFAL